MSERLHLRKKKPLSVNQIKLLKQHKYILKKLATANTHDRKRILKNAPTQLFQALNIIFRFLSDDNLNLSGKQAQEVRKHRNFLKLSKDLKTPAIKRKLQGQSGGFLGGLLKVAIPVISKIFGF